METKVVDSPNAIAVVGMSGRFPGARNIDEFWRNLAGGVESIKFFSDEQLRSAGVPEEMIGNPEYVPAAPVLDDIDLFDARFFQFSPREAEVTDPQHRLFLECAWEALEHAGYCGNTYRGAIGVFAGSGPSLSCYLASDTHVNSGLFDVTGSREHIGNDKDYLCTRVSYKLNLRGPSINVQTACSTSLVAVHLACQSLLMNESDIALAGGVTVRVPQTKGHLIRNSAMCSRDGHCRAFDADATGTVFGSGVGVVVLKRLDAAVEDRDTIHAIIRGSAVNNDGRTKTSYWASSAEGQVPAMVEAMAVSEVDPETITYVETHGTATELGDPVEIQALTRAFRTRTDRSGYCAIGSVKTNVGHLDAASGIVALIKAVLALRHATIPPSLHFEKPNPRIDFPSTPFFVNTECCRWDTQDIPRRAAVNSLGIGGTNAFAVLEEAPERPIVTPEVEREAHILPVTAQTEQALRKLAERYVDHMRKHQELRFPDVCFTAGVGRDHFRYRLAVVARSTEEAVEQLERFLAREAADSLRHGVTARNALPKVALLFSGDLGRPTGDFETLYRSQPTFRHSIDLSAQAVLAHTGTLLVPTLFPDPSLPADNRPRSPEPLAAFSLSLALAQLLVKWGIKPVLTAGAGAGEVTAACVAGAICLDDAVKLLSADPDARGQLPLTTLAAEAPPRIGVVSGDSAELVTQQVRTPEYWQTRRWEARPPDSVVAAVAEHGAQIVLKIGGASDEGAAGASRSDDAQTLFLDGLPEGVCVWRHLLCQLADLYSRGSPVDWRAFDSDYPRCRVELPTYPFQRKRYWMDPDLVALSGNYGSRDARLDGTIHPLLGRRVLLAAQPDVVLYETVIDASHPLLDGQPNQLKPRGLPESGLLVLAQAAGQAANGRSETRIDSLEQHEPFAVKADEPRVVQFVLQPIRSSELRLDIYSRARARSDASEEWTHHASARIVAG